jgi:hypothetical protein
MKIDQHSMEDESGDKPEDSLQDALEAWRHIGSPVNSTFPSL